MRRLLTALLGLALAAASHALGFSDITNWTGTGSNKAAMVVDWNDGGTPESLVWGYRWNGSASGEDMLRAIVAADPHLYIKVSTQTSFGAALFGIGYDSNGGGLDLSTGEAFTDRTITVDVENDGYTGIDGATAVDPADRYREGWYTGYWSYWVAEGTETLPTDSEWGYSGSGMTGRALQNGSWDGWSYDDFLGNGGSPSVPTPAPVPEPTSLIAFGLGTLCIRLRRRK